MHDTNGVFAASELFLELNAIRPFDILLLRGAGRESAAIRTGQELSRGQDASYSHAGLFLSPELLLESTDPGIVITQLSKGSHLGPVDEVGDWHSTHPRHLFPRLDNGKLKIYSRLQSVTGALVLRHKDSEAWQKNLWLLRERLFEVIGSCYLAEYPAMGRLFRTAGFFPQYILDPLESLTERLERKILTGPFCSELVMIALRAVQVFLSPEDKERTPESFNPSDLESLQGWTNISASLTLSDPENLPGSPVDETFARELMSKLSLPMSINQAFVSKLRLLETLVVQYGPAPNLDQTSTASGKTKKHLEVLQDIQTYIESTSNPLWKWVEAANDCWSECPAARYRAGHRIRLDEPTLSERLRSPSYKITERWDGSRCTDIRACMAVSPRWEQL